MKKLITLLALSFIIVNNASAVESFRFTDAFLTVARENNTVVLYQFHINIFTSCEYINKSNTIVCLETDLDARHDRTRTILYSDVDKRILIVLDRILKEKFITPE